MVTVLHQDQLNILAGNALGYAQRQVVVEGASLQADGLNLTVSAPLSSETTP